MKTPAFIAQLDEVRIFAEIAKAEAGTSGEIRVFVSSRRVDDPVAQAEEHFEKLGMTKTRHRNGVLLYFAPATRKFAVVGDRGIHEKCGEAFWKELIDEVRPLLQAEHFTEAVTHAVRQAGVQLARHFPATPEDHNELPNTIARE
jgi:uncharacterized membrane protein